MLSFLSDGPLSGFSNPRYDLVPGYPAMTPEKDGTWKEWKGVRFTLPILRVEGTPEEIGAELQALRDTCPWKGSYEAPEKVETPYTTSKINSGRWFRSDETGHYILWIGFYVEVDADLPRAIPGFRTIIPEWLQDRLAQAEEFPLPIESEEIQRHLDRVKVQPPSPTAPV